LPPVSDLEARLRLSAWLEDHPTYADRAPERVAEEVLEQSVLPDCDDWGYVLGLVTEWSQDRRRIAADRAALR